MAAAAAAGPAPDILSIMLATTGLGVMLSLRSFRILLAGVGTPVVSTRGWVGETGTGVMDESRNPPRAVGRGLNPPTFMRASAPAEPGDVVAAAMALRLNADGADVAIRAGVCIPRMGIVLEELPPPAPAAAAALRFCFDRRLV